MNALVDGLSHELFRVVEDGRTAGLSEPPVLKWEGDYLYLYLADIDYASGGVFWDDEGGLRRTIGSGSANVLVRYRMTDGQIRVIDTGQPGNRLVLDFVPDGAQAVVVCEERRGADPFGIWTDSIGYLVPGGALDMPIVGQSALRIRADATEDAVVFPALTGVYAMDRQDGEVRCLVKKDLRQADFAQVVCGQDGGWILIYEETQPWDPDPLLRHAVTRVERYDGASKLTASRSFERLTDYAVAGSGGVMLAGVAPAQDGYSVDSCYVSFDALNTTELDRYLIDENVFQEYYAPLYEGLSKGDFPDRVGFDTVSVPSWGYSPKRDEFVMIEPHSQRIVERFTP
ncbi:MAG: hypothetical protein LLG08_05255 [Actinomycetia bacterium]|nr:hypothetical protein [Actinomycetes bacterium]